MAGHSQDQAKTGRGRGARLEDGAEEEIGQGQKPGVERIASSEAAGRGPQSSGIEQQVHYRFIHIIKIRGPALAAWRRSGRACYKFVHASNLQSVRRVPARVMDPARPGCARGDLSRRPVFVASVVSFEMTRRPIETKSPSH